MMPPSPSNLKALLVFAGEDTGCPALSDRERQVLEGLRRGLGRKPIARELGVTPGSIAGYSRSICRKLGIPAPGATSMANLIPSHTSHTNLPAS